MSCVSNCMRKILSFLLYSNGPVSSRHKSTSSVSCPLERFPTFRSSTYDMLCRRVPLCPFLTLPHHVHSDMLRIMHVYGSEISNQTLPKRRDNIKKASIVRQFRRWNPEFFHWFIHVNGEWVPKLGKDGELKRRAENRLEVKRLSCNRKTVSSSSSFSM